MQTIMGPPPLPPRRPMKRTPFMRGSVYTTPALPPNVLLFPMKYLHIVQCQGYEPAKEGRLMRLADCPEGFAVWTGVETYCDLSKGLTLQIHPIFDHYVKRRLPRQPQTVVSRPGPGPYPSHANYSNSEAYDMRPSGDASKRTRQGAQSSISGHTVQRTDNLP